ncbi:Ff.00g054750.m01.CDS01 [Fusarium sp. VM40]|nr:Ff.00g054750.m01.CDS01 [Fusarium sp. VM40]
MAPIAAIIDKTTPDDKAIKLLYSTGNARLGLALWSGTKDPDPEDSIQTPQEVGNGQYILNPSQMASINFQGEEKVFALTTENPFRVTKDDFYNLSEIFPSYKKLQDIVIGNITLASCTSGDNAWIYFTRPIGESSRALWELDLRASQATQLIFTHDLWINSFAAAWFDTVTGKRNVIYEGSALTEYVVDDATNGTAIAATGDMQRNTPVAVAFNSGTVYLYYCGRGTAGGIRRSVKSNGRWGSSTLIDSNTIAQDSQLTVVRANGINHLFYVARDENEEEDDYFVHHLDEVA